MKPRFSAGLMGAVMILLLSQAGCTQKKKSVNEIAQEVTVIVDSCNSGSGVIFQKEGNTYSVLTARHVVSNDNDVDCLVITPDEEIHQAKANKFKVYEGLDLAVMQFESSKDYWVGDLEKSEKATLGQKIFIAGAPIPNQTIQKRTLRVSDGTIISTPTEGTLGRTLVYNNTTKQGMSGGPVLDEKGWVIGIHTAADPADGGREAYGVPIQKFLTGKVSQKPKDQDADTYLSRGLALFEKGDYQGAINYLDQAIKLNPNYAVAYTKRGAVRLAIGDIQGGLTDLDEAIKLNPKETNAYTLRGSIRYLQGDKQRALADVNQTINLNPNATAYLLRGSFHEDLGDKQGAIADYNQAIKLNPKETTAYTKRGSVRYTLGDKQGALTDLDQVIKLNPNDAKAYLLPGMIRSELGDKSGALTYFDQAIKLNSNYADAYDRRAPVRYQLGDKQGTIADLSQLIKLNPNDAKSYAFRGIVRSQLGDKQGAIKDAQKATELYQQQGNQEEYQKLLNLLREFQGQ
jgi:tetratricopeptide (TPR) repeat protein